MRPLLTALAFALMLGACDSATSGPAGNEGAVESAAPSVTDAVVQLPAVPGRPGAAYFTLHAGDAGIRLASVASDRVERIELHETRMEGDVMRMGPLGDASVQPNSSLVFEQGGRHAMLFGVDPALKAGDRVKLTLTLDSGETIEAEAEARAFGGDHASH